jgi:hypothetical protein
MGWILIWFKFHVFAKNNKGQKMNRMNRIIIVLTLSLTSACGDRLISDPDDIELIRYGTTQCSESKHCTTTTFVCSRTPKSECAHEKDARPVNQESCLYPHTVSSDIMDRCSCVEGLCDWALD